MPVFLIALHPLTSKHGKTNKDRGFLEFKISFQNVGKQESAYQVPAFQLANKEGSVAGGSSVGNATPESQSQTSGTLNKFDKNDRFLKAAENDFKYGKSTGRWLKIRKKWTDFSILNMKNLPNEPKMNELVYILYFLSRS